MKEELAAFGKVEQCELLNGEFHVRISGFWNNFHNMYNCAQVVINHVGEDYPKISKTEIDEGIFHLILKP